MTSQAAHQGKNHRSKGSARKKESLSSKKANNSPVTNDEKAPEVKSQVAANNDKAGQSALSKHKPTAQKQEEKNEKPGKKVENSDKKTADTVKRTGSLKRQREESTAEMDKEVAEQPAKCPCTNTIAEGLNDIYDSVCKSFGTARQRTSDMFSKIYNSFISIMRN